VSRRLAGSIAPGTVDGPVELPPDALAFLEWLAVEKGRSPATIEAYGRDLRRYLAHLTGRGRDLASASEADIVALLGALRAEGRAPTSIARLTVAVRGLHRFLAVEESRLDDPAADVETPPVPRSLPKALSEDDVNRLLEAAVPVDARGRRDRAILETLYGTGIRISELCGLSLGDLDLTARLARVFGKGSKERIVPVGRLAAVALADWLGVDGRGAFEPDRWRTRSDADAVFLNQRGGRLSRQGAWGVVRHRALLVGLGAELTPHVLRHSCATHMLDHGADIRTVQELLGHASISTTQIYTKVSTERLWRVYDAAHPRAGARPAPPSGDRQPGR
jgi:integrase/recombinase XerD